VNDNGTVRFQWGIVSDVANIRRIMPFHEWKPIPNYIDATEAESTVSLIMGQAQQTLVTVNIAAWTDVPTPSEHGQLHYAGSPLHSPVRGCIVRAVNTTWQARIRALSRTRCLCVKKLARVHARVSATEHTASGIQWQQRTSQDVAFCPLC
jgi:hypothetical protein